MRHLTIVRWSAVCLVVCAGIATAYLPPLVIDRPRFNRTSAEPGPAEAELREIRREVTRANDHLKRLTWLDALEHAAAIQSTGGSAVVLSLPQDVSEKSRSVVEAALLDAVDLVAPQGAKARIGFLYVDANRGGHPDLEGKGITNGSEFYVGEGGSGPYCYVVRVRSAAQPDTPWLDGRMSTAKSVAQTLGPCVFYAAFGVPGEHVQEWMVEGGHRLAGPIFVDSYPALGAMPMRRNFGLFNEQGAGLPLHACAGGDSEMCERLFLIPASQDPWAGDTRGWNPTVPVASFTARGPNPWVPIKLLGWARQEFGDDAFQRFWRSDLVVDDAFNAAFPITLDDWMQGWVRTRTGAVSPGPSVSAADMGGSLAFLLLCAALTLQFTRRRSFPTRMPGRTS